MNRNHGTIRLEVARRGRKPVQHGLLLTTLRQEIVTGKYAPGAQLPNQVELAERHGVSVVTVQAVLQQLVHEGFVEAHHRQGRFVAERPPHLHHYGLVFANTIEPILSMPTWSRYYQALADEALRLQQQGVVIHSFYGLGLGLEANGERVRQLTALVMAQRLAGLIFVNVPPLLAQTPLLTMPSMPRVALDSYRDAATMGLRLDRTQWLSRAAAVLAERQCRRVAVLWYGQLPGGATRLEQVLGEYGIASPPYLRQYLSVREPTAATTYTQLLMHLPASERPDALLITDDNLVEGAMAGLVAGGLRSAADLAVVAYANFPAVPVSPLPVYFLGYDVRTMMAMARAGIDRWRRTGTRPREQLTPVVSAAEAAATPILVAQ